MIPHLIPNLCGNEAAYLQQCVDTNFVSSVGPFVTRFEEMTAAASGAVTAVATSSGTTALHVALHAVGVTAGDLVLIPSLTFVATANAVSHCGARPWLVDIEPANWTLSPGLLDDILANQTRRDGGFIRHAHTGERVAAVMPVFTLGAPPDMAAIVATAAKYGLPVIADAAAALGATCAGQPVAASGGALYAFSFNGNKTVTAGGGGAVVGLDADLVSLVRHLTTTARIGTDYEHDMVGFNYRMTNLQAAVGCAQMENLDRLVARKRQIHEFYRQALAGSDLVRAFPEPAWGTSAHWLSGMVLADPVADRRDVVQRALRAVGVDARPLWKPMHLLTPYRDAPRTAMPVCDGLWRRLISLPSSTGITDGELETVARAVKSAIETLRHAPAD